MKLTHIRALLIILSFHAIFSLFYNLKNFEYLEVPKGISYFSYKIEYFSSGKNESSFIFMDYEGNGEIYVEDENGKPLFDHAIFGLATLPLESFKENHTIYITLRNNNANSTNFFFLDYSKEINIDFETFLNWGYNLFFRETIFIPIPLIFNVDTVILNSTVLFAGTYYGTIIDDTNILYYCLKLGNECTFKELTTLNAIKGNKYKFKLNPTKFSDDGYYSFPPININSSINDIEFGRTLFEIKGNQRDRYFIFKRKEYSYYNIYVNYNYDYFSYTGISEQQKKNIKEIMYNLKFNRISTKELSSINCYSDYLLIKIENRYMPYKGSIYIANEEYYNFNIYNQLITIEKGKYIILRKDSYYGPNRVDTIVSSSKSMVLLESNSYFEEKTNLININLEGSLQKYIYYIFVDSMEQSVKIKSIGNTNYYEDFKFNLVSQNHLNNIYSIYGPDSIFMRINSYLSDFGFNSSFIFGLDEEYYLFTKKYFGSVNVYQLNKELDAFSNLEELQEPIQSYETNNFKLITDELIIMSGYQIYSYFNSYGSFYDIYMQKVNDLEHVQLNQNMFKFNNLVKLFKKDKLYYLDFTVDHFIKLDSNFLNAEVEFTDNEMIYKLNGKNKVIKNLIGDNIIVKSDKDALVYFYKKIPEDSPILVKEFDKNQSGKNMLFTIVENDGRGEEITIIKDFGFIECYPIISEKNWEVKNVSKKEIEIRMENLYDKLEDELYEKEGEKYVVYVFDSLIKNNLPIFNSSKYNISENYYIDSLFTKENKYDLEVFPPNIEDDFLLLYSKNKPYITYQFFLCENDEIQYYIFNERENLFKDTIKKDSYFNLRLNEDEILRQRIFSNKESLFAYNFHNPKEANEGYYYEGYSILSINKLEKNNILIKFSPVYCNTLIQYHIIIAKKEGSNNKDTFSNPCYLAKLLTQNSDKIVVKTLFERKDFPLLSEIVDISKLNLNEDNEIISTIISKNMYSRKEFLTFYNSTEYKIGENKFLSFNFDEKTSFDFDKRSKFKFDYINNYNSNDYLILTFEYYIDFLLIYTDGIKIKTQKFEYDDDYQILIKLEQSGIYFFEFNKYYNEDEEKFENYFIAHIEKSFIEVIDLSQKQYCNFEYGNSNIEKEPKIYKVQNIKEDTYAFFNYQILDDDNYNIYINPFKVCNDNTKECKEEVIIYKFEKKYNYTIYINNVPGDYYYEGYEYNFYSPAYIITTGFENNIENNIEEGYYTYSEPKILVLNLEKKKNINIYFSNFQIYYYIYTNETFNKDNIDSLKFSNYDDDNSEIFNYYDIEFKYVILIPIFKINNYKGQVIIVNQLFFSENSRYSYNIPAQHNALIFSDGDDYEDDYDDDNEDFNPLGYNFLIIYNSTLKNIKTLGFSDLPEYNNIVPRNYLDIPIYVDKSEKSSTINVKTYNPRYAFFGVINDNALSYYKDYLQLKFFKSYKRDIKELAPFNIRVFPDLIQFDEFVNIYLSGIKEKLNIYIKKLYGPTELYECEADPIEKMDFSIITKPLSSCKNKKSIFNRLINLGGTKIFSGYLEHNSYFDGYLDFDDDNRTIELSYAYKLIRHNVKNIAKYLKKDIEYTLKLDSNYLAKLELTFDEEVIIYKDKDNILLTLNNNKLTGKLEKGNYKIKSNKGVMIYFYGELHKEIKQHKIDNVKGAYVEIKTSDYVKYVVDFGFEGYGPTNLFFKGFDDDEILYFENLYDKLQTKLIEGESLYFYYYMDSDDYDDSANINIRYIANKKILNNPKNDYDFYLVETTDKNKPLIINNMQYDEIIYRINYCETKGPVKMFYQYQSNENEESFTFSDKEEIYFEDDADEEMVKLRFESNVDFVFSYSYYDRTDNKIEECNVCEKDRIEIDPRNLNIKEINKKENSNIYSIKFRATYMYSSTRYIIVIAKKDDENSIENFSNLCYITKLVTHKEEEEEEIEGVKIINIYNIGEENYINVDVDLSDILSPKTEYIIGIISQELRFSKKLNCYIPITFSYDIESIKMKIGEEQVFDLDNNKVYFNLSISKSSSKNEMLLLNYKVEQQSYPIIQIYGPNGNNEIFNINKQEGFINFLYDKSGSYRIMFSNPESNYLKQSNSLIKGKFKMLSTESPFDLDIKKDNIEFEEFNIDRDEQPYLKFNIKNLDRDYIKRISIENIDNSNIKEIVSIQKNKEVNKNLNFHYYTFEKKKNYVVTIKFQKKSENKYTLEKFNIIDYSSKNIEEISSGNKIYKETNDKFLIINWKKIKSITITKINKEPELLISDITKSQSKNLAKEFQNIKFNKLTDFNITKPEKADFSVLMVEISESGTEINFDIDQSEDDSDGLSTGYIILISVGGLLVVIAIIFIIIRCLKKRQKIDFNKKAQEISQEKLLDEI